MQAPAPPPTEQTTGATWTTPAKTTTGTAHPPTPPAYARTATGATCLVVDERPAGVHPENDQQYQPHGDRQEDSSHVPRLRGAERSTLQHSRDDDRQEDSNHTPCLWGSTAEHSRNEAKNRAHIILCVADGVWDRQRQATARSKLFFRPAHLQPNVVVGDMIAHVQASDTVH